MRRNLVLATAALAAAGWMVAAGPTSAGYVVSGLKEYANAPPKALSPKDCRVYYNGELRLVNAEAFAKYLAKHRGEAIPTVTRRPGGSVSVFEPRRGNVPRDWTTDCRH